MSNTNRSGILVLQDKLKQVSERSGVYRMLDKNGIVIYVGKAKNLKKRLTNYTHLDTLSIRIRQMVEQIYDVITIETAGETEALLLESDLIKQFRPYYNILLKDDKSFPFILITADKTPRLQKYRGAKNIKGDYFGPFPSGLAVNKTITEIQKVFGLRTCADTYFNHRTRPCLLYQIGRCAGPCCGCISHAEYSERVRQTRAFLHGERIPLQDDLVIQMQKLSNEQRYEEAAAIRDKLQFLNQIQSTDALNDIGETDIVAIFKQSDTACVQLFFHRNGKTIGNTFYMIPHVEDKTESEILSAFLLQFYDTLPPAKNILVSHKTEKNIDIVLTQKYLKTIKISYPPFKESRNNLMKQALMNAEATYNQQIQSEKISHDTWIELTTLLEKKQLNKIEVYDNSHIQGAYAVGAMIAANESGFQKKWYRRFNINGDIAKTNDDFGMMREVLYRRLTRGIKENDLPDAIIIDGGKGQLSAAIDIFKGLNISQIALMAVAKGEKRNAGKETLFLSTQPTKPIHLNEKSNLQHLIQRLRDEAHRFAIGSHRQKRAKNMFHETLLEIEGIGQKRKKDLITHFGSVREIAGASIARLMRVPGINEKIAKKIYTFYHG
ncbi:MAG: excinuclease ABC subunit UvrC [Alphaproteobacteria bacterium]|nr:excinuclease ABC subunit UvrC [Alphaproteobacteria bacterium]